MITWRKHRAVRLVSLPIISGILLTPQAVPTEVVQWKADYEFVPLNATEFLDAKVQTKWESLYPGRFTTRTMSAGTIEY